jgi:hypothetical protein
MVVTGGGVSFDAGAGMPANTFSNVMSYPSDIDGVPDGTGTASAWTARGFNHGPAPHSIQAYAICVTPS